MTWAATLVAVVHAGVLAFGVLAPFSTQDAVLAAYVLIMPLVWVHWVLNDDTCALTLLERRLRGLTCDEESFIYRIVSPVYKIRDEQVRVVAWWGSALLWLVALARSRALGVWGRVF